VNTSDILLGRVSGFSPLLIYVKVTPMGPTMSVCSYVMSKGVHYIAFSVTPDVEHPRTSQNHSHDSDMSYAHECA
jgi:hypothetical protein